MSVKSSKPPEIRSASDISNWIDPKGYLPTGGGRGIDTFVVVDDNPTKQHTSKRKENR